MNLISLKISYTSIVLSVTLLLYGSSNYWTIWTFFIPGDLLIYEQHLWWIDVMQQLHPKKIVKINELTSKGAKRFSSTVLGVMNTYSNGLVGGYSIGSAWICVDFYTLEQRLLFSFSIVSFKVDYICSEITSESAARECTRTYLGWDCSKVFWT